MQEQGYNSVDDFIGMAQNNIVLPSEMKWRRAFVKVNEVKCTGCGKCLEIFCVANYMKGGKARIKSKFCGGCGFCLVICPESARTILGR